MSVSLAATATSSSQASVPPRASLEYHRAEGADLCPDEQEIKDGVVARLGYDPFEPTAPLRLRASVRRQGSELRGHVHVQRPDAKPGDRVLTSAQSDCAELASSMVLAISLAIDPLSLTRPPVAAAPPAPEPVPPPPPPVETMVKVEQPALISPEPVRTPARMQVSAGALLGIGYAPGPNVGAEMQARLHMRTWSVGLEARGDLPGVMELGGGSVSSSLIGGSGLVCGHAVSSRLGACAVASYGVVRSEGHGLANARSAATPYMAVGGRLMVELATQHSMFIRPSVELSMPLVRTELLVGNNVVWASPTVAIAFGLSAVALVW